MTATQDVLEVPVYIPSGDERLSAVLTVPTGPSNGSLVLQLWGSGNFPSFGRNSLRTRLARASAAIGYHSLRFDYTGVGDSTGEPEVFDMTSPPVDDARAAIQWLRHQGFGDLVLLAHCAGTRTALHAATYIDRPVGVALVQTPVSDVNSHFEAGIREASMTQLARKALRPGMLLRLGNRDDRANLVRSVGVKVASMTKIGSSRTTRTSAGPSTGFFGPFSELVCAGVPILLLYGTRDNFYREFERVRPGRLGSLLDGADHVKVQTLEGVGLVQHSVEAQSRFIDAFVAWLAALPASTSR